MSFRHVLCSSISIIASTALLAGMSIPANASQQELAKSPISHSVSGVDQFEVESLTEELKSLKNGESYVYKSPTGQQFKMTKNGRNYEVAEIISQGVAQPAFSACANTWAAIIGGIGTVALTAMAAAAGLASGGTILIAGASFTASQLGSLVRSCGIVHSPANLF
ncbi:hypothetical protein AAHB37_16020 [Glutamicibacter halophytocola]|uniref:hypothetical protein n=1 Tax=Glutamicibacter halophytocola TaxID=1933880 RepID=UPI00321A80C9